MTYDFICLIDTLMCHYIDPNSIVQHNLRQQGMQSKYASTIGSNITNMISTSIVEDLIKELTANRENLKKPKNMSEEQFYAWQDGITHAMNVIKKVLE